MHGTRIAILGATGGIGSALARQLHAEGARLFFGARGVDRLDALAVELGAGALRTDATVSSEVDAFIAGAVAHLGGLDGVALCVGSILLKPAHATTDADWRTTIAQNLDAAFFTTRAACKALRDGGGSLVLFSTTAARIGLANHEAIAAAKAGVSGLARAAAATYASRNVRVNVVAPGLVDTPLAARLLGSEATRTASMALHPLGRVGQADEVARVAAFLLDPRNSWITGEEIGVDGGLSRVRPQPRTVA